MCQAAYGYLFSIHTLQYFLTLFQTQVTKQIYTIKFKFHFNFISYLFHKQHKCKWNMLLGL